MIRPSSPNHGFVVIEALVALVVSAIVIAALVQCLTLATSFARVQPAAADLADRARASWDLLRGDATLAGTGPGVGDAGGSLALAFPVVLPRRIGRLAADPPDAATTHVVSFVRAVSAAVATRLAAPLSGGLSPLVISTTTPCPVGDAVCGWDNGASVVAFDGRGQHDYFMLTRSGSVATTSLRQPALAAPVGVGAWVVPVETQTYAFDAAARQLRHYNGAGADVVAVDDVVGFEVSYVGSTAAPRAPKSEPGVSNCLFDSTGSRWPWIQDLAGGIGGLVDLPVSSLADGPWCGLGPNRFDVDLLRIRRVVIRLRLQAPDDLRATGGLFAAPGTSRSSRRLIADRSIAIDVAPRNLDVS